MDHRGSCPVIYKIVPVHIYHNHPHVEHRLCNNLAWKKMLFDIPKIKSIIEQNIEFGILPNFCLQELNDYFLQCEELTYCIGNLKLEDLRHKMSNHKRNTSISWSVMLQGHLERLQTQNPGFKFVTRKCDDTCNEFRAVFYYHEHCQQSICKGYAKKIHLDSSFNCTWDKLLLLNVVVMDCNNHYFVVGSVLYHKNHKKASDFFWMMETIRTQLFKIPPPPPLNPTDDINEGSTNSYDDISSQQSLMLSTETTADEPSCIVIDRELAMLIAVTSAFRSSYVFLCTLHIKRDVCGWLVPRVKSLLVDAGISVKKGKDPLTEALVRYIYARFQKLMYDKENNIQTYQSKKVAFTHTFCNLSSEYFTDFKDTDNNNLPESFLTLDGDRFKTFGKEFIKYLHKEWFMYEHMICNAWKRLHMCFLLRGTLGTNNPSESMMGHTKLNHEYRKKNVLHFITDSQDIFKKEYSRFENAQNEAKIMFFGRETKARTHGLYSNLVGTISYFAIEHMYNKLNRVVDKFNSNDFSYVGTCSILRMIKDGNLDLTMGTWKEVQNSAKSICSCITQGLYCGEYQVNSIEGEFRQNSKGEVIRNFPQFAENWKNNVEDMNVRAHLIPLQPDDISIQFKVVNPIAPPPDYNEAENQSDAQLAEAYKGLKVIMRRRLKGIWERFIKGVYDNDTHGTYKNESGIRWKLKTSSQSSQQTFVTSTSSQQTRREDE